MKLRTTVTGLDAAKRAVSQLDPKARAGAKRGVARVTGAAVADIKSSLTHERTGLMRKSLGSKVRVNGAVIYGVAGPRLGYRTTLTEIARGARSARFIGFRGRKGKATRAIKRKVGRGLAVGDVIDPAKYASFVEFGHRKGRGRSASPAYPFIRPAEAKAAKTAAAIISAEVSAAIRRGGASG